MNQLGSRFYVNDTCPRHASTRVDAAAVAVTSYDLTQYTCNVVTVGRLTPPYLHLVNLGLKPRSLRVGHIQSAPVGGWGGGGLFMT